MSDTPKITLAQWAKRRYDPPPSLWVLRQWVRRGEIVPMPELVGKSYYVDPHARRVTADAPAQPRLSLVGRLKAEADA